MRKIKIISLLITLLFTGNILFAQTIDEGKRFLYYERYTSAKDAFNKLVNANPNNVDAAYWLGQVYLNQEGVDINAAKALYQKTLNASPNSPLLLVGMGEVALLENNPADARNRFETAISLSKGKDYNVLNAIARANVNAKAGDAAYAIEKIKSIPENKRTAEIWTTLGDAYRKMTDGSNAQISYQSALAVDPNYARANFMIGRIYQTQGTSQEPYYMKYYNEAMARDPKFAPVYAWLSEYYYRRDINKAREYLDKYIGVADPDSKNCYYQASFLYASSKFQESINKANECIAAGGQNPYLKLYGLKAFAYDKLSDVVNSRIDSYNKSGDTITAKKALDTVKQNYQNAKTFFQTYFQKQKPENLESGDYETYARVLMKFPGNEALASSYIEKAVAIDTLESDKVTLITNVANSYVAAKNYNEAAKWYSRLLTTKKNVTKTDIYNVGYNYYRGGNYKTADSVFTLYQQKYPDDMLGYYYSGRAEAIIDSTGALGLAKPTYEKLIQLASASTDTVRSKPQLITAYNYMIAYYYKKNDYANALTYVEKILALDPANAQALENRKALLSATKVKTKGDETKIKTPTSKEKITPEKTKVKGK